METAPKPAVAMPQTTQTASIFPTAKVTPFQKTVREPPHSSLFSYSPDLLPESKSQEYSKQYKWEAPKQQQPSSSSSIFKPAEPPKAAERSKSVAEMFGFSRPVVINETHKFQPSDNKPSFTFQPPKSIVAAEPHKVQPQVVVEKAPPAATAAPSIFASSKLLFGGSAAPQQQKVPPSPPIFGMPTTEQIQRLEDEKRKQEERLERERLEQERKLAEEQAKLERARKEKEKKEELLRKKLLEEKRRRDEKREEELKRKKEMELKQCVHEVVRTMVNVVAELDKIRREDERKLMAIITKVRRRKLLAVVAKWRRYVALRKRKRKIMEQSPTWLPDRTVSEEAKELYTESQSMTLRCAKRYKLGKSLTPDVPRAKPVEKLNVHRLVHDTLSKTCARLRGKFQREIFWKVAVKCEGDSAETVRKLFDWKKTNRTVENCHGKFDSVTYCVERYDPSKNDADGLIYIMDGLDRQEDFDESAIRVPIAVVVRDGRCEYEETECGNRIFVDAVGSGRSLAGAVAEALRWLAAETRAPPPLELDVLQSFLHRHLASELWQRIRACAERNSAFAECLRSPNVAVNLHNEAVDRLKRLIVDASDAAHVDFPEEFKPHLRQKQPLWLPCGHRYFPAGWNAPAYKEVVSGIVETLRLPPYDGGWPPREADLEPEVLRYCQKAVEGNPKVFYRVMAVILRHVSPDFETGVGNVLWPEVVNAIVVEKLRAVDYACAEDGNAFGQHYVVYNAEDLARYQSDAWFYVNNAHVAAEVERTLRTQAAAAAAAAPPLERISKRRDLDDEDIDLDEAMANAVALPVRSEDEAASADERLAEFKFLLDDLERSMKIHRDISDRFEKTANAVLQDK